MQDFLNKRYTYSENLSDSLMGRFYNRLNVTMFKNANFTHIKKKNNLQFHLELSTWPQVEKEDCNCELFAVRDIWLEFQLCHLLSLGP